MTLFNKDVRFVLVTIVVAGVFGIALAWQTSLHTPRVAHISDSMSIIPPPTSLKELVSTADIVVLGTVGPIIEEAAFAGYGANGELIDVAKSNAELPGLPSRAIQRVDYSINIEQVLKGNEAVASAGGNIILRMPGKSTGKVFVDDDYPMSAVNDRHLFFLRQNPDRKTYGLFYGPWGRLIVDGISIAYSDGKRTPPEFARNVPPSTFIKQVLILQL